LKRPLGGRAAYPYLLDQARRVTRDAYVCYQTNRYSVPWQCAGQEVSIREEQGQVQVERGGVQIASHSLCTRRYQTLTHLAHNADIPLSTDGRPGRGKAKGTIRADEPEMQVRSLAVYEEACQPGGTGA